MSEVIAGDALGTGRRFSGEQRVWAFSLLLVAGAIGVTSLAIGGESFEPLAQFGIEFWVLVPVFVIAELLVVHFHVGRSSHSLSLSEIPTLVGLAFLGPLALIAARVLGSGYALAVHARVPPIKLAFNLAMISFETSVAIAVWRFVLGDGDVLGPRGWLAALVTIAVADVLSSLLFVAVLWLFDGTRPSDVLRGILIGGVLAALANASFGVLVILVLTVDWRAGWTLVAVATALVLAYRAYNGLQRKHESSERLWAFTRILEQTLDPRTVATTLLEQAVVLMRAEVAELALTDAKGGPPLRLLLRDGELGPVQDVDSFLAPVADGDGLREPVLVPRPNRRSRRAVAEVTSPLHDLIAVPLRSEGRIIGSLLVGDRLDDVSTFDAQDLQLLETVANQATVAIENSRLVERLRDQAALNAYQATHDELTGLANRSNFHRRVAEAIRVHGCASVFLMDLDQFKEVNDTLGHGAGDVLLQQVARRLEKATPAGATVARLGGDEFAVVLGGVRDRAVARRSARQLEIALTRPINAGQAALEVRASIGIALAPEHAGDAESLLQRADVAMYVAKAARTGVEVYDPSIDHHSRRRLAIMNELRAALETNQLAVHYQPKVELRTGTLRGFEALVRWRHPEYGAIAPDEFIPLAEQTGLIGPLTEFVLRTALEEGRRWRDRVGHMDVAVNIAARSLLDNYLPDLVERSLLATGMPAGSLTLEITETGTVLDSGRTADILARLSATGVRLSIDDFGTGYSSLSRLRHLPVDEIKIDRSFVTNMVNDDSDCAIVRSTVDLARHLGLSVVAEGIEDAGTARQLVELGCSLGQGYHFGRPMPSSAIWGWFGSESSVSTG
jgi:diguanylate cyclase (GGDEF)-like protein